MPGGSYTRLTLLLKRSFRGRPTLLAEDPSPLTDILSHGMKMVVRNQVFKKEKERNKKVKSIMTLAYDA